MRSFISCPVILTVVVLINLPTSGGDSNPDDRTSPKMFLPYHRRENLKEKGVASPKLVPLVYSGVLSEAFPFMVALVHIMEDGHAEILCGASLITDKHLLTAAHCLPDMKERMANGQRLEAWMAPTDLDKFNGQRVKLKAIFEFPYYNGEESNYTYDIGLVKLEKAVHLNDKVSPITIGTGNYDSEPVTLIGFGLVDCVTPSRRLLKAHGKCIGKAKCVAMGHPANLLDSQICAEMLNAKGELSDAGQGDSGGPLFQRINGEYVQIGLVSYSYEVTGKNATCVAKIPGTYTRVGTFLPFLQKFAPDTKFS